MADGKRAQRFDVAIPVRFRDDEDYRVQFTQNISTGGLFIHTDFPPPKGTTIRLSLEPPGARTAIPVVGEVAFSLPPDEAAKYGRPPGCGIRFVDLDPGTLQMLESFVVSLERRSRGNVLVVDDDADILNYLAELLRRNRFNVVTALSATNAIKAIPFGNFDVILSDLHMPRMDGFEFRDKLSESEETAGIPFVVLTGKRDDEVDELARKLGVFSVVSKPVAIQELVAVLAEALQVSEQQHAHPKTSEAPAEAPKTRTRTQRLNDIAFRKLEALGLAPRPAPEGKGVVGSCTFEHVALVPPGAGDAVASASFVNVGHDRIVFTEPELMANLTPIEILDLADKAAFEEAVEHAFGQRSAWVRAGQRILAKLGLAHEISATGFCALGRAQLGPDQVLFTVRDELTLVIEAVSGKPLTDVAPASACVVDISDADSGNDIEMILDSALSPYRQALSGVAGAPAPGPELTAEPLSEADLEPLPLEAAPQPAPAPVPEGWLGTEVHAIQGVEETGDVSALFGSMDDLLGIEEPAVEELAVLGEADLVPLDESDLEPLD